MIKTVIYFLYIWKYHKNTGVELTIHTYILKQKSSCYPFKVLLFSSVLILVKHPKSKYFFYIINILWLMLIFNIDIWSMKNIVPFLEAKNLVKLCVFISFNLILLYPINSSSKSGFSSNFLIFFFFCAFMYESNVQSKCLWNHIFSPLQYGALAHQT